MASRIFVVSPLDAGEGPLLHTIPKDFAHGEPCVNREDWLFSIGGFLHRSRLLLRLFFFGPLHANSRTLWGNLVELASKSGSSVNQRELGSDLNPFSFPPLGPFLSESSHTNHNRHDRDHSAEKHCQGAELRG